MSESTIVLNALMLVGALSPLENICKGLEKASLVALAFRYIATSMRVEILASRVTAISAMVASLPYWLNDPTIWMIESAILSCAVC